MAPRSAARLSGLDVIVHERSVLDRDIPPGVQLAESRSEEVQRLLGQVEDLRAEAARAREETRRLQAQLDRRPPAEAAPAGSRRGGPRKS